MWWNKKKKDKDKIIKEIIKGGKTRGFIFPPYVEDVYSMQTKPTYQSAGL